MHKDKQKVKLLSETYAHELELNVLDMIICPVSIMKCIKNNAWVTVNNDSCHEWGDSAMIFTSDEVTSDKNRYSR